MGEGDVQLPSAGDPSGIATLRRIKAWEERVNQVLQEKVAALEGESLEKEVKYRRLVSLCTKVPVEKVDGVSVHRHIYTHTLLLSRYLSDPCVESCATLTGRCWITSLPLSSQMDPLWI